MSILLLYLLDYSCTVLAAAISFERCRCLSCLFCKYPEEHESSTLYCHVLLESSRSMLFGAPIYAWKLVQESPQRCTVWTIESTLRIYHDSLWQTFKHSDIASMSNWHSKLQHNVRSLLYFLCSWHASARVPVEKAPVLAEASKLPDESLRVSQIETENSERII